MPWDAHLRCDYILASRAKVHDFFDKARAAAPCVLFLDELDSFDTTRRNGEGDSGFDFIQIQLLKEVDGCGGKRNVIVMGATSCPDYLDQTLLQPASW